MKKSAFEQLFTWKESSNHKLLNIKGVRLVANTRLIKTYRKVSYAKVAYLNFESNQALKTLEELLLVYKYCKETWGMESLSMGELHYNLKQTV